MPAARRPFHPVRHQQSPLRHAKRHHGRQEKRNCHYHPRIAWHHARIDAENRKNLRTHKNQKNRIPNRHAKRSRNQAGRKTQVRSARDLENHLSREGIRLAKKITISLALAPLLLVSGVASARHESKASPTHAVKQQQLAETVQKLHSNPIFDEILPELKQKTHVP